MSDDEPARPSLLLARHDMAHREHQHLQHHHHYYLHRRQAAASPSPSSSSSSSSSSTVTEVIQTVSIIQQVNVVPTGNTYSLQTLPDTTESPSPAPTDPFLSAILTPVAPEITSSTPLPSSATPGPDSSVQTTLSLIPSPSTPIALTSTPSIPTTFSSLSVNANSTNLISSSGGLSNAFSNSTISSSRSSVTYLRSTSSSSSSGSSTKSTSASTSSSSSFSSFSSSSSSTFLSQSSSSSYSYSYFPDSSSGAYVQATATSGAGIIAGGAGTTSATGASDTTTSTSGSDTGRAAATPTPVVVGSVVGSVAGASLIILALLFILKWWKQKQNRMPLGDGGATGNRTVTGGAPSGPSGGMVERRSLIHAVPAALASLTGYKRPSQNAETNRDVSPAATGERGFYRVSGRKLPSVLRTGGDGYGDDGNTLIAASFFRDSQASYGGTSSPPSSPGHPSRKRDSGIPVIRPSPARTPVTQQGPFTMNPPPLNVPPRRPGLGRSQPSHDSHTSRFTEEV